MNSNENLDPELKTELEKLRVTPVRDPQMAASRRAAFLAEAESFSKSVSPVPVERHNDWKTVFTNPLASWRKEKKPMFNFVMAMVLVFGLVFGGGSVTLAAAQASMPDEVLYPVKTWSEQTRLQLAGEGEERLQVMFQLVNRRMEEVRAMLQDGKSVPEPVLLRLQEQLRLALQWSADLPDEKAMPALMQLREQLRLQERDMVQLQLQPGDASGELTRERVRSMLEKHLAFAEEGVGDLLQLRQQLRQQTQDCDTPDCPEYQYQNQNRQQNGPQQPDPKGTGENPWTTGTPTPGSSYGPGESQNPWTDDTPTPGSGYGPGPGYEVTIQPQPSEGPGPQPSVTVQPTCTPLHIGATPTPGDSTPKGTPNPGGNGNKP